MALLPLVSKPCTEKEGFLYSSPLLFLLLSPNHYSSPVSSLLSSQVIEEVDDKLQSQLPSFENVERLEYLEAAIKETLR